MTVSEMPGDTHEMSGVLTSNINNALGLCSHEHRATVTECKAIAICELDGFRQIQKKLSSRCRAHRDAAAVSLVVVELDNIGVRRRIVDDAMCDKPTHCQYKKYLWAIGSSEAGSQVNSSPSARTS